MSGIDFILSTASLFNFDLERICGLAAEAGFTGLELMVTKREETQSSQRVRELTGRHGLRVDSIHAPFLMGARKVWGDYAGKIRKSLQMAQELNARVVVIHLPYFWQWRYAHWLRSNLVRPSLNEGVQLAVENAMLLRVGRPINFSLHNSLQELAAFQNLVFDTSHFAIAGVDIFRAWETLKDKVRHVHLSNNYLKGLDDHALPFDGRLPLDRFLKSLSREGYQGKVALELGPGPLEARLGDKRIVRNLRRSLQFCLEASS